MREIGQHRLLVFIEHLSADGDFQHHVPALRAGAVLAHAVGALAGLEVLLIARIHIALGEYDEAWSVLDQIDAILQRLQIATPDVMVVALRGVIRQRQGRREEALAWVTRAEAQLALKTPRSYLIAQWCAEVLQALGEEARAQAMWRFAWQALHYFLQDFPEDWRQRSLHRVDAHRRIAHAAQALQQTLRVRLPRADAPTGRPLREDEWVEVHWTLHHPDDERFRRKAQRRRHRLLRLLQEARAQGAAPTIPDLARALQVSPATVKRDLAALRAEGASVSTRGSRAS
jgi:tetratricopeptide (TPR) repeat protein